MLFWWRGRIGGGKELGSGRRVRVFPSLMMGGGRRADTSPTYL
jgi:hypothetical protein